MLNVSKLSFFKTKKGIIVILFCCVLIFTAILISFCLLDSSDDVYADTTESSATVSSTRETTSDALTSGNITTNSTQSKSTTGGVASNSTSKKKTPSTSSGSVKSKTKTSSSKTTDSKSDTGNSSSSTNKQTTSGTTKPAKQYYTYSVHNYKDCVYGSNYTSKTYQLINTLLDMTDDIDSWDTNTKYSSVISNITKTDEQLFMSYVIENYGYVAQEGYVSVEYESGQNGKIKVNKNLSSCINKRDIAENEINNIIKSIPKGTKLEICEYLAKEIADEINYQTGYHDIYDAVVNHRGVCDSYAKTFKTALDKIGIKNDLVLGIVGSGSHCWNVVYIDGKEYYYDLTSYDSTHDESEYLAVTHRIYHPMTLNNYYY